MNEPSSKRTIVRVFLWLAIGGGLVLGGAGTHELHIYALNVETRLEFQRGIITQYRSDASVEQITQAEERLTTFEAAMLDSGSVDRGLRKLQIGSLLFAGAMATLLMLKKKGGP